MENAPKPQGGFSFYGKLFKMMPGGVMMIPLLFATVLNTLFPGIFGYLGGMTTAMFQNSSLALAGIMLFATGTSLDANGIRKAMKRGTPLFIAKMVISFGAGIAYIKLFGMDGVFGVSAVTFVCGISACNPGVYQSLMEQYGDDTDLALYTFVNIATLPCWPLLVFAASGGGWPIKDIATNLVPLVLGIICGNLDKGLKRVMMPVMPIALLFMGFSFGSTLDLITAVKSGLSGIAMSVMYIVINGGLMFLADRIFCKRPGYCGLAWTSLTGISMVAPSMLGAAYASYVPDAMPQLMLTLIISSIVTGYLVKGVVNKYGAPKKPLPGQVFTD